MSSQMSSFRRTSNDHFQPQADLDPHAQRTLRGKLEHIDYIAYLANREMIEHALTGLDAARLKRLAAVAAQARAHWASLALALTESGRLPNPQQVESLAAMRATYEELAAAYDGLRRMVERGYLAYPQPAAS